MNYSWLASNVHDFMNCISQGPLGFDNPTGIHQIPVGFHWDPSGIPLGSDGSQWDYRIPVAPAKCSSWSHEHLKPIMNNSWTGLKQLMKWVHELLEVNLAQTVFMNCSWTFNTSDTFLNFLEVFMMWIMN